MYHNSVRDTTHELLQEVRKDVKIEPAFLPVTGEELPHGSNTADRARLDVSALSFWLPLSRAFFNVKVVNSFAQTNWPLESNELYKLHEKQKKDAYIARIVQVEEKPQNT